VIFYVGKLDPFAYDIHLDNLSGADLPDLELHGGPGLPPHLVGALLAGQSVRGLSVDLKDFVAAADAVFLGGGVLVGFVDDHVAFLVGLVDDGSDSAVGLPNHHLEVFILLFGDVHGVGVEAAEHRVDPGPADAVQGEGVHVRTVEFLDYRILDFSPFPKFEAR